MSAEVKVMQNGYTGVPNKEPNPVVVRVAEGLLEMAKSGKLQSFVGTGFTSDGLRLCTWADLHPNVCEMRGAIAWLESEYANRHAGG